MTISPGTMLGPYEVLSPLGAGGMGEVFKARDTRLGRSVAIKVLPSEFASNAQLRTRFEREAKTISQLSHPNICALYDVGDNYLVMELLEGETLGDRIARGPLPIDQVLRYGMQIAEALDRAHKEGIVHRDLKPGNVMITKSGAKLLDFGLAKSAQAVVSSQSAATQQKPLTEEGAIVGTIQYMAPEQIDGAEADARTDIFALGEVLYEMATGHRAFSGKTRASLIASIVAAQPEPIASLQPLTPRAFEAVVGRCLEKDPNDRWQCASDLRWELGRVEQKELESKPVRRSPALPWAIAAVTVIAAAVAAFVLWEPHQARFAVTRFEFEPPPGWIAVTELKSGPPAVSPDGRSIVFVGTDALSGRRALWLRSISDTTPRLLEGTDEASRPFWSPDSRSIAFFGDNNNKLKRVEISGGPPQLIAETQNGRGGSWGDGAIVFAPLPYSPMLSVDPAGGTPVKVMDLDAAAYEKSHRWPSFLPDGKRFFFVARRILPKAESMVRDRVYVGELGTPSRTFAMESTSNVMYDGGYVFFVRERTLFAQRFDVKTLKVTGPPLPIVSQLQFHASGFGMFSVGASTLVYQAGTIKAHLELYDRATEKASRLIENADQYAFPRFSADGKQIVYDLADATGYQDVWLFDRERKVSRRMTTADGDDFCAQLSPDGKRLYFTSNRSGTPQIYVKPADGGDEKVVHEAGVEAQFVQSISRDERYLLYVALGPSQNDIGYVSLADGSAQKFAASAFDEIQPQFSPDTRFVAFTSNESGRYETYIAPFPSGSPHIQISVDGGTQPAWRGDGRELFYVNATGRLMSVPIETTPRVTVGTPVQIVDVALRASRNQMREYDVSADGRTILLNTTGAGPRSVPFTVVLNWAEELKNRGNQ